MDWTFSAKGTIFLSRKPLKIFAKLVLSQFFICSRTQSLIKRFADEAKNSQCADEKLFHYIKFEIFFHLSEIAFENRWWKISLENVKNERENFVKNLLKVFREILKAF